MTATHARIAEAAIAETRAQIAWNRAARRGTVAAQAAAWSRWNDAHTLRFQLCQQALRAGHNPPVAADYTEGGDC